MTAGDILTPLVLMTLGVTLAIYSKQAGVGFCRLGKTIWRINTFGLTDMRWFYSEERAPRTMRLMGIVLCLMGIMASILSYLSLSGPNSFAAMRQANNYLSTAYGKQGGETSFSCTTSGANDVIVRYRYGQRQGNLRGSWDGHKYIFTQVQ